MSDNDPAFINDVQGYEEDDDIPTPDHSYLSLTNRKSDDKRQQRKIYVTYENQRWWLSNWTATLLPGGKLNINLSLYRET